ncbi:MAG: M28 family peptidase [Thermodesulfobacteriota bacterium]|nr:M28 family peptidase [Thermodesulfobacteriota bacterium]
MPASGDIANLTVQVDIGNLRYYTSSITGLRHAWKNPSELEERAVFVQRTFDSFGLAIQSQVVPFHGRTYRNIIGTLQGKKDTDLLLVGAHYDAALGSPGADDNASGVAVFLEAARILSSAKLDRTLEFVAFTLEEPQLPVMTLSFLIGSRYFAGEAGKKGVKYKGVLILESVGYTSERPQSQSLPPLARITAPDTGNFLAVIANRRSKGLLESFCGSATKCVPELPVVGYKVPFSGRLIPETRFSDHAPFWDQGYPALMLTDTAMFRNPNYHTPYDRLETLDFTFMSRVAKAVVAACCNPA